MGRYSKRSLVIRKGWETRKLNLQKKISVFQEKVSHMDTENKINETQNPSVVEAAVETPVENNVLIKKIGRRGRPPGTFKVKKEQKVVNFDSVSTEAFTFEQVRDLGVKAIYDGRCFRLLKSHGRLIS
jgi:hypothetical protein